MRKRATLYLGIAIAVVTFDVAASFLSKSLHINYLNFAWGSWGLYTASGYLACRRFTFLEGILGGAVAGLSDSTIGWAVSFLIGPYISYEQPNFSPILIAIVIIFVTMSGTIFGLLGALLSKLHGRLRYSSDAKR